jgi:hypothetical protein
VRAEVGIGAGKIRRNLTDDVATHTTLDRRAKPHFDASEVLHPGEVDQADLLANQQL